MQTNGPATATLKRKKKNYSVLAEYKASSYRY